MERSAKFSFGFFLQRSVEYQSPFCKMFQMSDSNLSIHKLMLKRLN